MTTVTSLTADRMLAIEAASVVDGDVVGDNLILTKHDGSQINAGSVRGPQGTPGPVGQDLPILTATPVLDVGLSGQIRAGRQLTAADFTNMGLSAPLGLWNLSDLSDVSGNGRNLLNKGAIPFDVGINGAASTAAKFVGNTAQGLYISDTGVADPFRIKFGSLGCWFRSTKRGTQQALLVKSGSAGGNLGYFLQITTSNLIQFAIYGDGTNLLVGLSSVNDIADDRWHFAVAVYDGTTARVYIDGVLESTITAIGSMFLTSGPLNIGSFYADGATAAGLPVTGRIDEAFITADVLSEDQVRNLYCAKIPHTLAAVPSRSSLNVHRRLKGAALAVADFPTQPLRLHNFSAGSVGDEGSQGAGLSTSTFGVGPGVDGTSGNGVSFISGQALFSTDVGLPIALATRSYGCWLKTAFTTGFMTVVGWGTPSNAHVSTYFNAGAIGFANGADAIVGPYIADGLWHHVVVVENNTSSDGIKRKLYVDGRFVAQSTVMNPITSGGANYMRIGLSPTGGTPFVGQFDAVFICDYALTAEQITRLYIKSLITFASSPKNVGDHVEAMSSNNLLAIFDTLEPQHTVDLMVAA